MKLSSITILVMGFCLMAACLSFGYFMNAKPNWEETRLLQESKTALDAVAAQKSKADKRVKDAKATIDAKGAEWQSFVVTNTPPSSLEAGGIDMAVNPQQLVVNSRVFRDNIQLAVNEQVKVGGVKVVNGPAIPPLPDTDTAETLLESFYNYPAVPFPVVIFDFGTVTVQGTYEQIMTNVRSYKKMKRYFAVADGLQITGTSPNMTGTYSLSVVGFIRATKITPKVPMIVAGSSTTSGVGGPGGGFAGPGAANGPIIGRAGGGIPGPGGPGGMPGPGAGFSGGK